MGLNFVADDGFSFGSTTFVAWIIDKGRRRGVSLFVSWAMEAASFIAFRIWFVKKFRTQTKCEGELILTYLTGLFNQGLHVSSLFGYRWRVEKESLSLVGDCGGIAKPRAGQRKGFSNGDIVSNCRTSHLKRWTKKSGPVLLSNSQAGPGSRQNLGLTF